MWAEGYIALAQNNIYKIDFWLLHELVFYWTLLKELKLSFTQGSKKRIFSLIFDRNGTVAVVKILIAAELSFVCIWIEMWQLWECLTIYHIFHLFTHIVVHWNIHRALCAFSVDSANVHSQPKSAHSNFPVLPLFSSTCCTVYGGCFFFSFWISSTASHRN